MSKTIALEDFLRTFNLRDGEVLSVARSMDEDDIRVEVLQFGKVNGVSRDFVVMLDFTKAKSNELPWKGLKISRAMMSTTARNECTLLCGNTTVKIAYLSATVTLEDGYDTAFSIFR